MPELPTLLFTYLRDERGTVTMEYVLWLPILLAWLILSTVLYDAYKSRDDAAKAAYTVADIISRETELSASDIRRLADLQRVLVPRAGNSMFLRLTSFTCTAEADCLDADVADTSDYAINWSIVPPIAFSDWEDAPDDEKPSVISTLTQETVEALPLMAKDDTIVLVDVSIPFRPIASWVGIDAQEWAFRVAVWPRLVADIELTSDAIKEFGGFLGT